MSIETLANWATFVTAIVAVGASGVAIYWGRHVTKIRRERSKVIATYLSEVVSDLQCLQKALDETPVADMATNLMVIQGTVRRLLNVSLLHVAATHSPPPNLLADLASLRIQFRVVRAKTEAS